MVGVSCAHDLYIAYLRVCKVFISPWYSEYLAMHTAGAICVVWLHLPMTALQYPATSGPLRPSLTGFAGSGQRMMMRGIPLALLMTGWHRWRDCWRWVVFMDHSLITTRLITYILFTLSHFNVHVCLDHVFDANLCLFALKHLSKLPLNQLPVACSGNPLS